MASPGTGQGGQNGDDDQKVAEAFDRQVPKFARKVKFLYLIIIKGESYVSWRNCINQQAELADLENIRAQDLQLMKFCQGLNKTDRLYDKLMEMDVHSWATAQNIIENYSQSMALKADLFESAPKSQGHVVNRILGSSGSAPRPASRSPGGQRRKFDTDNRGRYQTKAPAPPTKKGFQSLGQRKSGSR